MHNVYTCIVLHVRPTSTNSLQAAHHLRAVASGYGADFYLMYTVKYRLVSLYAYGIQPYLYPGFDVYV